MHPRPVIPDIRYRESIWVVLTRERRKTWIPDSRNRNFKRPFGAHRKVPERQRRVMTPGNLK